MAKKRTFISKRSTEQQQAARQLFWSVWEKQNMMYYRWAAVDWRMAMFNILYKMVISLLWLLWWLLVRYHFIRNLSHMKIDRTNKTQTQYNNREKNALEILVRSFNSRRINDIVVKNENRFDFYDSFSCISNWKYRNGFPIIFKAKTPKFAIYL